jgi:hypothetical protein
VPALMNSRAAISPVGQVPGDHPGDLRLLRREDLRGPGVTRAGPLAGGAQFGPGPAREGLHVYRVEHHVGGTELEGASFSMTSRLAWT